MTGMGLSQRVILFLDRGPVQEWIFPLNPRHGGSPLQLVQLVQTFVIDWILKLVRIVLLKLARCHTHHGFNCTISTDILLRNVVDTNFVDRWFTAVITLPETLPVDVHMCTFAEAADTQDRLPRGTRFVLWVLSGSSQSSRVACHWIGLP